MIRDRTGLLQQKPPQKRIRLHGKSNGSEETGEVGVVLLFLFNYLIALLEITFKPENAILEVCDPVHNARMVVHALFGDGQQFDVIFLLGQQRQRLDEGTGVVATSLQNIERLEVRFEFLRATRTKPSSVIVPESLVKDSLQQRHEHEVRDQRDVDVVSPPCPPKHGFDRVSTGNAACKCVPREGMREFMGKNASHTLIVILVYRTHFVHVLDGTILLQILVVVDQSSVHDQNGSYP